MEELIIYYPRYFNVKANICYSPFTAAQQCRKVNIKTLFSVVE